MSTEAQITVARRQAFSSAHLYKQDQFNHEENLKTFGACYTEHGHGHNYVLEAFISGPIDARTRLVINLSEVDELLKDVTRELDHRHLNFDVDEFKTKIPTTENIALYLREKLKRELARRHPTLALRAVRLYENGDLWAEILE